MKILAIFALFVLIAVPTTMQAQDYRFYETLAELNRIDPMQNPRVRQGVKITGSDIKDRKNKVVGYVSDLVLNKEGNIQMLNIGFDKLNLPSAVYMAYDTKDIRSYSNGYGLNINSERIEDIYPELLAGIVTGSGTEGDSFSMNTIKGAFIETVEGHKLGKVTDILFNKEGTKARSLFITLTHRSVNGQTLAIPYETVKIMPTSNAKPDVIISRNQLDTIIEYMKVR